MIEGSSFELLHLDCKKIRTIEVCSAELLSLHQEVLGPRCKAPGVEVHSTESSHKAPWIEMRSTELSPLNWGDVQLGWAKC